jgi:hypothetical protein
MFNVQQQPAGLRLCRTGRFGVADVVAGGAVSGAASWFRCFAVEG